MCILSMRAELALLKTGTPISDQSACVSSRDSSKKKKTLLCHKKQCGCTLGWGWIEQKEATLAAPEF